MKKNYILFLLIGVLLSGCQFRDDEVVDFANIEAAKGLKFRVIGQHETDLSEGLPYNCYLPDGTPANEYTEESAESNDAARSIRRTTGTTGAGILQELLPKKGVPKRMILVSHYTVCSNAEAPSNCFSLEGMLVKDGYGLIIPDYLGYGVTAKEVHPYLVMDLTARNVLDMYLAVRPWLEAVERIPDDPNLDLMGYSQGGATTMAVQHLIETEFWDKEDMDYVSLHRVFAGGGPYDVKATYERFVTTDTAGYPVAVPLVLQGMIKGNKLNMELSDMMKPFLCEHIDEWINSKHYTSAQINQLIGSKVTHELLTDEAMEQKSEKVAELYKAMTVNSIVSQNWEPQASVYIMHSIDDETVPYTNAVRAKSKWRNANITYNFGHYGGHVMTCLRFIYSVRSLLEQEEEERRKYEN